jgi:hypothetical protein
MILAARVGRHGKARHSGLHFNLDLGFRDGESRGILNFSKQFRFAGLTEAGQGCEQKHGERPHIVLV